MTQRVEVVGVTISYDDPKGLAIKRAPWFPRRPSKGRGRKRLKSKADGQPTYEAPSLARVNQIEVGGRLCNVPVEIFTTPSSDLPSAPKNPAFSADRYLEAIAVIDSLTELPIDVRKSAVRSIRRRLADEPAVPQPAPSSSKPVLPSVAPELYRDRSLIGELKRKENAVEFLQRVWGKEMKAGLLTRADLRRLDPGADTAVENWLRHRPLPEGVVLPTKREVNDTAITNLSPDFRSTVRIANVIATRIRKGIPIP